MLRNIPEPSVFEDVSTADEDDTKDADESNEEENNNHGDNVSDMGDGDDDDDDDDTDEMSNSLRTSTTGSSNEDNRYFAAEETIRVRRLKFLVFGLLFLVTVAVCFAVYFVTAQGQQIEMEGVFEGSANKVLVSFQDILQQKIAAIASLGVTFTSYAQKQKEQTNTTWPFVTMNNFQQRAASATSLSDAYFMELLPIVNDENRAEWEEYSVANKGWLSEGREFQAKNGLGAAQRKLQQRQLDLEDGDAVTGDVVLTFTDGESSISDKIFTFDETFAVVSDPGPGPYFPIWQSSPILPEPRDLVNYNLVDYGGYGPYIDLAATSGQIAIGGLDVAAEGGITHPDLTTSFFAYILSFEVGQFVNYTGDPMSSVYVPVVDSFEDDRKPVAVLVAIINWATYFENTLPINAKPVAVVLENTCDGPYTYEVSGDGVKFLGKGNLADPKYEDLKEVIHLDINNDFVAEETTIALTLNQDLCQYSLSVYPTQEMDEFYNDSFPLLITMVVAAVFMMTAAVFAFYDLSVERRQSAILDTAKRSTAIVSSIFPRKVRDQLMEAPVQGNATKLRSMMRKDPNNDNADGKTKEGGGVFNNYAQGGKSRFTEATSTSSGPIADLFPDCTVFFGDVEGFTAWSSTREPCQVFTLLETIYSGLDRIAARRRVFKVETVGDCYVAVAGLPDVCADHAVVMARFAKDCIAEHIALTKKLEVTLGPDTGDLRIRIGLHSGPITAGVLRGERSRFQLFGDTVNTASRLESSGRGNEIHISEQTANLLIGAGHPGWVKPREDTVNLKGKGVLKTFWLLNHGVTSISNLGSDAVVKFTLPSQLINGADSKTDRLIHWNVDVLVRLIKQILHRRQQLQNQSHTRFGTALRHKKTTSATPTSSDSEPLTWKSTGTNPLEEVVEIIHLPDQTKSIAPVTNLDDVHVDPCVIEQVRNYVIFLARMYRDNPFHNFEHASHVTMSVAKLLSRIIAPSDMDFSDRKQAETYLNDHTYGITSDPLTQFACVLSALIHDVDHQGVTNTRLIEEHDPLATLYKGKSVAEQNSVEKSWDMLMADQFSELRSTICANQEELARFRQLVVNSVMATDIMDKDLKNLRNARWDKAFDHVHIDPNEDHSDHNGDTSRAAINRKATIVIEHLIQASDVSHTMQHWNVYQKWNGRLYREMYKAFKEGRAAKDPSEFWYKGEIGFFDFYIIPLAKKLKDCGVFGVSSDEFLTYATNNRNEWERKGESVVADLIVAVKKEEEAEAKRQARDVV